MGGTRWGGTKWHSLTPRLVLVSHARGRLLFFRMQGASNNSKDLWEARLTPVREEPALAVELSKVHQADKQHQPTALPFLRPRMHQDACPPRFSTNSARLLGVWKSDESKPYLRTRTARWNHDSKTALATWDSNALRGNVVGCGILPRWAYLQICCSKVSEH